MTVFAIIGMTFAGLFGLLVIYAITGAYIRHCAETDYLEIKIERLRDRLHELNERVIKCEAACLANESSKCCKGKK